MRWSWHLGAVSEAVAHLLYWTYRLWVMLTVTTVVVFVTSPRSLKAQATSRAKVIDQKVVGSNPGVGKRCLVCKCGRCTP